MSLISVNEKQRIIVDQNQIKIGIDCLHQLIFVINDRWDVQPSSRASFLHRFLNNSLRIVLETCSCQQRFDDLQAKALTMKPCNVQDRFPSLSCSLWCTSKSSFRPAPSARYFFYSLADHSTNVAFRRGWIRHVSWSAITKKKKKKKKGTCSLWKILWWWTPGGRAEENIFAIQATIDHSHC